jgi:hypothetical protein
MDSAADAVHEAGDALSQRLKTIRMHLSHKYGVPFVAPGSRTI